MVKRFLFIIFLVYLFFVLEIVLSDLFGAWAKPQLLLILVVFWGLYSGIRYSIVAGVLAGLLKDSYSIVPFGTHLVVFVACAYLTTFIRQNLYQPGSRFSRAVVVFFVLLGSFFIQTMLYLMNGDARFGELFLNIYFPALFTTMLVVTSVFHRLRDLAVWFKV